MAKQPRVSGVGSVGARTFSHSFYVSKRRRVRPTGGCRRARLTRPGVKRVGRAAPGGISARAWNEGAIPGVGFPHDTTSTTASLSSCNGGRTAAVAGRRCSCSRRTTLARRANSDPPLLSARKITTGILDWRCWVGSLTLRPVH